MSRSLDDFAQSKLPAIAAADLTRRIQTTERGPGGRARRGAARLIAFCDNDYLGLSQHPAVIAYVRSTDTMTLVIAANLSATGASTHLDLSRWQGSRVREVLWGCDFPPAARDWFVYLPAYGFYWWMVGEQDH